LSSGSIPIIFNPICIYKTKYSFIDNKRIIERAFNYLNNREGSYKFIIKT